MNPYGARITYDGAREAATVDLPPDAPWPLALVALAAETGEVGAWRLVGADGSRVYCARDVHGPEEVRRRREPEPEPEPEPVRPCVAHYGPHDRHTIDCATPAEWDAASRAFREAQAPEPEPEPRPAPRPCPCHGQPRPGYSGRLHEPY